MSKYVWNGQSWQALDCAGVNLPSGQTWHHVLPSPGANLPTLQSMHDVNVSCGVNVPDGHSMQSRDDSYVPAEQPTHANLDGTPLKKENVPGPHAWQSWTDPLYCCSRYVWNGQSRQALELAGAYLPSTHTEHS